MLEDGFFCELPESLFFGDAVVVVVVVVGVDFGGFERGKGSSPSSAGFREGLLVGVAGVDFGCFERGKGSSPSSAGFRVGLLVGVAGFEVVVRVSREKRFNIKNSFKKIDATQSYLRSF